MKDIDLIVFDLNGTLIEQNTWVDINRAFGVEDQEDKIMYEWHKNKIINYRQWQNLLKNIYVNRGKINQERFERIVGNYKYKSGAQQTVQYLNNKYKLAIITASVDYLARKISSELEIEIYKANNSFVFNKEGEFIDLLTKNNNEMLFKHNSLLEIIESTHTKLDNVVCIGDDENDSGLFQITRGITFRGKKIEGLAWKVIDELDELTKLL